LYLILKDFSDRSRGVIWVTMKNIKNKYAPSARSPVVYDEKFR